MKNTFEYGPMPETSVRYIDYGGFRRRLILRAILESVSNKRGKTDASSWLIWQAFGW